MTRKYELVYVVSPEASDDQVTDLHNQVEAIVQRIGGSIEKTENWGRRRLAYEIGRHKEGTYVLESCRATGWSCRRQRRSRRSGSRWRCRCAHPRRDLQSRHFGARTVVELSVIGGCTANVPSPLPSSTETLLSPSLATTRSL